MTFIDELTEADYRYRGDFSPVVTMLVRRGVLSRQTTSPGLHQMSKARYGLTEYFLRRMDNLLLAVHENDRLKVVARFEEIRVLLDEKEHECLKTHLSNLSITDDNLELGFVRDLADKALKETLRMRGIMEGSL